MSDVVRLNLKSGNVKLKFTNEPEEIPDENKEEDYFTHQLQDSYERGFKDGQNQLRDELEQNYIAQLSEKTQEFNKILAMLEANLSEYDQAFDKVVLETALMIAEKIVRREINRESIITNTLRDSVKKIIGANDILIKINPVDHNQVQSVQNSPLLEGTFSKIKFELDENLEPGGCLVETEIGNVDSRITTQINEIKKQLEASFINQA
ncbi:MAG: FliH/SctL family protein [Bacteroidota bacterium]|nr:FliH/SctL family protein [Bacteroidota bacterium]MDP4192273.1 FliH/SctL family protein [Bacteroidota bacterium]MDP4195397.1 FliH/SctL family protein [Bacteroidota bacterium]